MNMIKYKEVLLIKIKYKIKEKLNIKRENKKFQKISRDLNTVCSIEKIN